MFLLREGLIFDKIYQNLNPCDKRKLKIAFKDDPIITANIERKDTKRDFVCPSCIIDTETDSIPWSEETTALNRRPITRVIDVKYPTEHLVIRTRLQYWRGISPNRNYDGDNSVIRLNKATDYRFELFADTPIVNTDSTIGRIKNGAGKIMFHQIFGSKQYPKFKSKEELEEHFKKCHQPQAVDPKPERFWRAYNRGQQEMELRSWPMWDVPLNLDAQYNFPVWGELRDNLFYVKRIITHNVDLVTQRNDWNSERVNVVMRHKAFRAYLLLMNDIPPLTTRGRNLNLNDSLMLYHITALFHCFEHKIIRQGVYNINLNSTQIKHFANIILLGEFVHEYFSAEFGMKFSDFIGWDLN